MYLLLMESWILCVLSTVWTCWGKTLSLGCVKKNTKYLRPLSSFGMLYNNNIKHLSEKMDHFNDNWVSTSILTNYTDCICEPFLHCVSSWHLDWLGLNIRTGCIHAYLIFVISFTQTFCEVEFFYTQNALFVTKLNLG